MTHEDEQVRSRLVIWGKSRLLSNYDGERDESHLWIAKVYTHCDPLAEVPQYYRTVCTTSGGDGVPAPKIAETVHNQCERCREIANEFYRKTSRWMQDLSSEVDRARTEGRIELTPPNFG